MAVEKMSSDPGIITSPAQLAGWLDAYFGRNSYCAPDGYPMNEPSLHASEWRLVLAALRNFKEG